MESDAMLYKLLAWGDANKKQLLVGLAVLIVAGLVIGYWMIHQNSNQNAANDALSRIVTPTGAARTPPMPEAYLKVAADYPGTDAGQRAQLLAAVTFYSAGKFDEAKVQFQRFLQEHGDSPLVSQAALGVAASLDAQGKTDEAINAYRNVTDHYPAVTAAPAAKLALARLLESQGKYREAGAQLDEIARTYPGAVNSEARQRLERLILTHPELMNTNAPSAGNSAPTRISTPPSNSASAILAPANRPAVPAANKPAMPATTNRP